MLDAIHAGAVVVTEHSSAIAPLVPGVDVLVASPDALPYVLETALGNPDLLERLRANAYERIRASLPFALSVSVFRAAAVELLGRPVSPGASLGCQAATPPDNWTLPAPEGDSRGIALSREVKYARAEVIALGREISRLEQAIRSGGGEPDGAQIVEESLTWSACRNPRVTVITAIADAAAMIGPTLDSLARSRFRDFEVVMVDDAVQAGSLDLVREWMGANSRVPALLARRAFRGGLGAARNTALDLARAPYCLILDAGDEIYPRALEVLVATLDAMADVAMAYPIVEVAGMTEPFVAAGGDYLLNVYGWEPGRLRLWARGAGLSLVHTERLRELGGFATEPQLEGWEDHDLWCRVADRGWRAQLAPQVLGRYRASPARVTGLSDAPPVPALIDRAPRLLAGVHPVL